MTYKERNDIMDKKSETKQNNVFITLLVIIMTVAVVVAVAGAIAKNTSKPRKAEKTAETTRDAALREDRVHDAEDEVTLANTEKATNNEDEETESSPETTVQEEKEDVFAPEALPDFSCPVDGEILKEYSMDVPVFSLTMEDYRTHGGVDIYAAQGAEVLAAAGGTVREVWSDPMMGQCISINHAGGAVTTYKNLSPEMPEGIEKGAAVSAGQVIGTVGDTALEEVAEESHLHFEMSVDGSPVDPAEYITFTAAEDFEE